MEAVYSEFSNFSSPNFNNTPNRQGLKVQASGFVPQSPRAVTKVCQVVSDSSRSMQPTRLLSKPPSSILTQTTTSLRNHLSPCGLSFISIGTFTIYPFIIGKAKYLDRLCRVKFMELLKTLTPMKSSSILAREIQDFELKRAVV